MRESFIVKYHEYYDLVMTHINTFRFFHDSNDKIMPKPRQNQKISGKDHDILIELVNNSRLSRWNHRNFLGSVISPVIAEAATVAGEAK